jgi:hypothetical protein
MFVMIGLLDNYTEYLMINLSWFDFVYRQMICRIILLYVDLDVLARLVHILFDLLCSLKWLIF